MNILPRNLALAIAVAASTVALGACRDDTSKPVGDVLAQDSSLDLAVLSASGDSSTKTSADTPIAMMSTNAAATQSVPAAPVRAPAPVAVQPRATIRKIAAAPVAQRVSRPAVVAQSTRRQRRSARLIRSTAAQSTDRPARVATVYTRPARTNRAQPSATSSSEPALSPGNKVIYSQPAPVTRASSAMIPAGSSMSLVTNQKICVSSAKVGDTFNARLAKEIVGPSGMLIPEGSTATGEVIALPGDDSRLRVAIRSIDYNGRSYPVGSQTSYTDMQRVKVQSAGGSTSRVLAGAGIGAIIGRVIGKDARSTMIGAAGGAVAGGVIASRNVQYDQCVPSGGQIVAHLTQPLTVQLGE